MSESFDPLSAVPNNSLLGMSFTPDSATDEPQAEASEVPIPEDIPQIIRVTWELDSQIPPFENRLEGMVFTLHRLAQLPEIAQANLESEELDALRQIIDENPDALVALPFALPDDGDDFLQQLPRLVWSENIEGVAVVYETDAMLTAAEMQAAPHEAEERQHYLETIKQDREKSRFVVAATREESWSVVHPKFESDPEHIEQGPALVLDLLQLITNGRDDNTDDAGDTSAAGGTIPKPAES